MRIEVPKHAERFGSLRINDIQKVLELDSGWAKEEKDVVGIHRIEKNKMRRVEKKLAVVVPIKNDKLRLLEGVLAGIPHDCLTIVLSNSERKPIDRFKMEKDVVSRFCHFTQKEALIAHQKDPAVAKAFQDSHYTEILENGRVRDGKAEGMIIGIILAKLLGKKYVGFIDADNYIPGAVHEYVKNFVAGFCLSESPYVMVRNSWHYKPKVLEGRLYFTKWGRISRVTNRYFNQLISSYIGFESEVIKTGNAGEHALTLRLADVLQYSSGYSIEPYELAYMLEEFGGLKPTKFRRVIERGVDIFQIETRNPHFHEDKGDEHLDSMLLSSLSTIYHSDICPPSVKKSIREELSAKGLKKLPQIIKMPNLQKIDPKRFQPIIESSRVS